MKHIALSQIDREIFRKAHNVSYKFGEEICKSIKQYEVSLMALNT